MKGKIAAKLIISLLLISLATMFYNSSANVATVMADTQQVNVTLYPSFSNGQYPEWKNFTITNTGLVNIVKITITFPATTPEFKPVEYRITTTPATPETGWIIQYNPLDRLIEFTSADRNQYYIPPGGSGMASIKFSEGPSDPTKEYEFIVTVSDGHAYTFYIKQWIDKLAPNVDITFPGPESLQPDGQGYAFVKKPDGDIWVQMPNCTVKNIGWLWVNGTANDPIDAANPFCSGINRVEIWVWFPPDAYDMSLSPVDAKTRYPNGLWAYLGDATLSVAGAQSVTWWWRIDPTKEPSYRVNGTNVWVKWTPELWYQVKARAFDNSVNDDKYYVIDQSNMQRRVLLTNNAETQPRWFFWFTETKLYVQYDHKPLQWAPGNGRIDVYGETGFYPNGDVNIYLQNELYNIKILLKTVKADNNGRFYTIINHLPEVPRKPTSEDRWTIFAVDTKGNNASDKFYIIPWITYEPTKPMDDASTWQTTISGHVGDTITVYGHGFLPSRQSAWDPYSTVYVKVVYTDVAPLDKWDSRSVWNGTGQYNVDNMAWYPRLNEIVLAEVPTDVNGYWSARITIPQSYGGYHAIYAYESRVVTDTGFPGPKTSYVLVKSGWPQITKLEEEQAVIFDVWPTITVAPSTAIQEQYVTITGEGLPLPKYYKLWKNRNLIEDSRDWCMVIDFGPQQRWVFENQYIRNNEFDLSWAMNLWYPFSFYMPDPRDHLDSLVWAGKLTSTAFDHTTMQHYHNYGSQYLAVPVLPPGDYKITVYYWNKNAQSFTHDHEGSTEIKVIKDPLNVYIEAGTIHFPGEIVDVLIRTDIDGMPEDVSILTAKLYRGSTFIKELSPTRMETGLYVASFTVPEGEGNYFITASASKAYDSYITLQGAATTSFTVSPTLNGFDAKLKSVEGRVATLETKVGTLQLSLDAVNAKLASIDGEIVTVNTAIGSINTTLRNINSYIEIDGDVATIRTDLETVKGKVTALEGNVATIVTEIGTIKAQADSIKSDTGLQPASIGLSVIAAIAAIAAAGLILRKVYLK